MMSYMPSTLSKPAKDMIAHYEALSIGGKSIRTPYYNNKRAGVRGGLRVLVGKGSPSDIEEEVKIISLKKHLDLTTISQEDITHFLVDNNIGVECSGFVYHVLNAEKKATNQKPLAKLLSFPSQSLLRKIITRFRPIENTNVKVLGNEKNGTITPLSDITAGDLIIMLGTGDSHDLDHVLIVTDVDNDVVSYAHSLNWKQDGKYNHGIRRGTIMITDIKKPLAQQVWEESGESGEKNETLWRATTANELMIKRI